MKGGATSASWPPAGERLREAIKGEKTKKNFHFQFIIKMIRKDPIIFSFNGGGRGCWCIKVQNINLHSFFDFDGFSKWRHIDLIICLGLVASANVWMIAGKKKVL